MTNFRFQLRKVATIVACLAVIIIFFSCTKDDRPLTITFTDIPAEYNGMDGRTFLFTTEDTYVASSHTTLIANGKVSAYLSRDAYGDWTIYSNEKYCVHFKISEYFDGDSITYHWEGDSRPINITKSNTTLSFNSLKKLDETYPYTVDLRPLPQQITITDIPAEHSDKYMRYGFVYLLKPADRELYAYSFPYDYDIKDRRTWTYLRRVNAPPYDLDRGKYIVAFKIKERRCTGATDCGETIYWEGESEPMDIIREITEIPFNTLKKWDRTYPFTTDQTEQDWKDRNQ